MGHLCYEYPMDRFKELEPLLKQWFNIDRNTTTISKCLSISFTADQLMQIQSQIPEEYSSENGNYDIVRYTYDHSDVLAMPFRDEINTNDLVQFFNNYEIEEDTVLNDTLLFLFLYNEVLHAGFGSAIEDTVHDYMQYAVGVRPEMLKLYIALHEATDADTIKIRFGNGKPVVVDSEVPWLRDEIKDYLHRFLGVESIREAKLEYAMNYAPKLGAPKNRQVGQYALGIYKLLEETGFIKSQTEGKPSRKQAKFIEDFLTAIHLIDINTEIDANNIRSRLNYFLKNNVSIEEITEEMSYKFSPNNKGTKLF